MNFGITGNLEKALFDQISVAFLPQLQQNLDLQLNLIECLKLQLLQ